MSRNHQPNYPVWGRPTLWYGGSIVTPAHPHADAMLTHGRNILAVGIEANVVAGLSRADAVDLEGALVTPAFVDAHVHLTATGLAYRGLDLTVCQSAADILDVIADRAHSTDDGPILGHGWDETRWARPSLPHRTEIDRAASGRVVYLTRLDLHSALVSSSLLALCPKAVRLPGFHASGHLVADAHDAARVEALRGLSAAQRREAHRSVRARAARHGIALLHELAGPQLSSAEDLAQALALNDEPGPEIIGYWGEIGGAERARELGALGVAGDIFADGTIGSHTAHLRQAYADLDSRGRGYLTAAEVRDHVVACATAGLQAGFHAIGDACLDTVVAGFEEAAAIVGRPLIRAGLHRIEHLEMVDWGLIDRIAALGLYASMQPNFDATWGGRSGMYAKRLGTGRADAMNPFAQLARAQVPLVFGSDSPVTRIDPWSAVLAAVHPHNPAHALSVDEAFVAHTVNGWMAAGRDGVGHLLPGAPATFAVWRTQKGLDEIAAEIDPPHCVATVLNGIVIHCDDNDPTSTYCGHQHWPQVQRLPRQTPTYGLYR